MSFKAYDTNTYSFIYPSKQVDITTLYNAIGEKLQQSGVVVNFSLANGAGLWQGVGGENRVISIIERGLFFCFVTVPYLCIREFLCDLQCRTSECRPE